MIETVFLPAIWFRSDVEAIAAQTGAALARFDADDLEPVAPGFDLWDMWPIAQPDGSTAVIDGRRWWFFLATPQLDDPEARHDVARMRLTSHGDDGWRDHGWVFAPGFTPGSREWSGSAVLEDDGETLQLHFTATGHYGGPVSFEQRLFVTSGRFTVEQGAPSLRFWSEPVETAVADARWYAATDMLSSPADGIKGFRDPGIFRDPADGADYLLFTGSAIDPGDPVDGVVGLARREGERWIMLPPIVTAIGTNSELERPHIVVHGGRYHLFWSTQRRRFAPDLDAPTGLYAMVADNLAGPWQPANGTGLVACNPPEAPMQAYCWWVTGELDVISFADYPGVAAWLAPADAATRRLHFGGTVAPWFSLEIDGDAIRIARP